MPLYLYTCPRCKRALEETRPVERRDDPVRCFENPAGLYHDPELCVREPYPGHSFKIAPPA
jgi:hypothetical protein